MVDHEKSIHYPVLRAYISINSFVMNKRIWVLTSRMNTFVNRRVKTKELFKFSRDKCLYRYHPKNGRFGSRLSKDHMLKGINWSLKLNVDDYWSIMNHINRINLSSMSKTVTTIWPFEKLRKNLLYTEKNRY